MITRRNRSGREPMGSPEAVLWQRTRSAEAALDDAERYLDLAGFADGLLDPDDRERVAEWLAGDPTATSDVAVARTLAGATGRLPATPEAIALRATSLVVNAGPQRSATMVFWPRRPGRPLFHRWAGWGTLAAAMVVASWLGFTLGADTSLTLGHAAQASEDGFLHDLLDPSTAFMRDPTGGAQT